MSIPRNLSIIADTLNANGTFASITDTGNLTFTGTGNRITGDFSNATIASRAIFQTSTVNGLTTVSAIPNGTSPIAGFSALSASDPTNSSTLSMLLRGDTGDARFTSGITGTGTYLPMTFYTGGSERMRLDTSGNLGIGVSTVATNFRTQFLGTAGSNTSAASSGTTQSASAVLRLQAGGGFTGTLDIGQGGGTGSWLQSCDTGNLATTYPLLLNPVGGNVGIGTASPSYKLDVAGVVRGTGNIIAGDGSAFVFGTGVTSYVSGSSTSNVIDFYTSSTARMRLDSSGNVGIGTSAPGQLLDVNGNIQVRSGNKIGFFDQTYFIRASTGLEVQSADFIRFLTNGANERMRIDSSGNVAVGTSSPVYRLSVVGPNNTGIASFSGNNNGVIPGSDGDATLVIGGNYAAGSAEVDYFHNNSTYKGTIGGHRFLQRTGASTTRDLMWLTENQTTFYTAGTERMRLDSSGNVGIGTSSPSQKLDVVNTANSGISIRVNSTNAGSSTYGSLIFGNDADSSISYIQQNSSTNTTLGGGNSLNVFSKAGAMTFSTASTERIRLDSSGNVGIGTNAPSSSAILDAQSTTKGVRMPNMTTTQKNAISSPAAGLMVFDTTLAKLCVYSGSAWQTITSI